jgi:nucleoside-diphosphate-sugar epimerase
MKILITGASGFVGTHLTQKLLNEGHTVYGLVRTPSKMSVSHPNFILVQGDLNLERLSWTEKLPADLDVCVHTAGIVHAYNHDEFTQVNVTGTKYLVNALKAKYPERLKFILISSLAAAGPVNFGEKKDETQIDFPVSEYGRSKKAAENVVKESAPKSWKTSIIRPPMIIGPGDVAVLDIFKMVKSRVIVLPGLDSKIKEYSFVCVYDLIETITRLMTSDEALLVYSANERIVTFKELIEEIKKQMRLSFIVYLPLPFFLIRIASFLLNFLNKFFHHNVRLTPDKIYELKASAWTCDSERTRKVLGQNYRYDLKETVAVTLADYQKRHWL